MNKIPFIFTGWGIVALIVYALIKVAPDMVKTLPDFYKTLPLKVPRALDNENSKTDQKNTGADQNKIICENYWTFNNEFQDIRKTKIYKESDNKEDKIRIIKKENKFVRKEMEKDLKKAKSTNCQLTSKEKQMLLQNMKYFDELNKEIEKTNTR